MRERAPTAAEAAILRRFLGGPVFTTYWPHTERLRIWTLVDMGWLDGTVRLGQPDRITDKGRAALAAMETNR